MRIHMDVELSDNRNGKSSKEYFTGVLFQIPQSTESVWAQGTTKHMKPLQKGFARIEGGWIHQGMYGVTA